MNKEIVKSNYKRYLQNLFEKNKLSKIDKDHFLDRSIQVILPNEDYGLKNLSKFFPQIIIGASSTYIKKMKIPYQATSYIAANISKNNNGPFVYKIPNKSNGGISLLSGGKRKITDNLFAALHRILFGKEAIIISANNLMANKSDIWNWCFFADNIKKDNLKLYQDIKKFADLYKTYNPEYFVITARSDAAFKKLRIIEEYEKNKISMLNQKNQKIIFITNSLGFEYASKNIYESDQFFYINTGEKFNISYGLKILRNKFNISIMLNDGGRQMSNGIRDQSLLGEERITLVKYPGDNIFPKVVEPTSILGQRGLGIDSGELYRSIKIDSILIDNAQANIYQYRLNDKFIL